MLTSEMEVLEHFIYYGITIKDCKYGIKASNFIRFEVCVSYFKISVHHYVLTGKVAVVKSSPQILSKMLSTVQGTPWAHSCLAQGDPRCCHDTLPTSCPWGFLGSRVPWGLHLVPTPALPGLKVTCSDLKVYHLG